MTAPAMRPVFFACGLLLVGLGIVGYFVPIMPMTIFLILAADCFSRSSPKVEHWLLTHKIFGPPVRAWRETGAIPRKAKIIAVGSMIVSMAIICLSPLPEWVDWAAAGIVILSAAYIVTRPEGKPKPS